MRFSIFPSRRWTRTNPTALVNHYTAAGWDLFISIHPVSRHFLRCRVALRRDRRDDTPVSTCNSVSRSRHPSPSDARQSHSLSKALLRGLPSYPGDRQPVRGSVASASKTRRPRLSPRFSSLHRIPRRFGRIDRFASRTRRPCESAWLILHTGGRKACLSR